MSYGAIADPAVLVNSGSRVTRMYEYRQVLNVLTYGLTTLLVFGIGLLWAHYRTLAKRRPRAPKP
jgi:hypothetical protein